MFAAAADFVLTPITVQTYQGTGGRGPIYAAPVKREVFLSERRKLVRSAAGDEVISESTVFDDPDQFGLYADGSLITANGKMSTVITSARSVIGDPDIDHCRADLT